MTKLVVRDRHWIDGRGQALVVHADEHVGIDLTRLKGELVEADGKTWLVVGVESFVIGTFQSNAVSLLVRPSN